MKKFVLYIATMLMVAIPMVISAQSNDEPYFRHSIQFNIAGLGFERWGLAYEIRMTPQHALFVQGGGSFWGISEESEYGFGLHYKHFLPPVSDSKFLWLFKSAYRNTFWDANIRYFNLTEGLYKDAACQFDAFFVGLGYGQTHYWNSGFTISYWLGYGPPIGGDFVWQNTIPEEGESYAKTYKWTSGLDFGLTLGYSFGRPDK